jgi:hypothetical protein
MTSSQLGVRSGFAVVYVGVAYVIVLVIGMARHGLSEPIGDPILAIMEVLTILSALLLLALFVALHAASAPERKPWATLALVFVAMFSCATMGAHVVELTAGRALAKPGLVWPSVPYAVELFAWDFLLGAALLLAAQALLHAPGAQRLRAWLRVTGALCIIGLLGPLVGNMRIQLIGVAGYAVAVPVVAWMLAKWFQSERSSALRHASPAEQLRRAPHPRPGTNVSTPSSSGSRQ